MSRMKRRRLSDGILNFFIWFFSFITIGVLAWILIYILYKGIGQINLKFLTTIYNGKNDGILPMLITTIYMIFLTVAISSPIGICSAIYLIEYSKPGKVLNLIRFTTETLAGIPSIIYGLFGYLFFGIFLHLRFSILSGALTMSIMVLPTIIRATEEALKSVPPMYIEGSLALGASKLKTILKVVLPCAIPGVLTAIILSIGRIVGETAALMFTLGTVPRIPTSIFDSGRTLSEHLYMLAKEGISFEKAFATATVLIIVVALINLAANKIGSSLKKVSLGNN